MIKVETYKDVVAPPEWVLEDSLGAEKRKRNIRNVTVQCLHIKERIYCNFPLTIE